MGYKTKAFLLLAVVITALFSPCGPAFCSEEQEYGEFYSAANEAWADYIGGLSRMECTVVLTGSYPPRPEFKTEITVVFDFPYCAVENKENGVIKSVSCFGRKYSFRLDRNAETGSYEITNLQQNKTNADSSLWNDLFFAETDPDDPSSKSWRSYGGGSLRYLIGEALVMWGDLTLPRLLRREGFSIEGFSDDGEKIRVDYKLEPEESFSGDPEHLMEHLMTPERSGHFVLSKETLLPESVEFSVGAENELQYSLSCEYESADGKNQLKKKTMTARKAGDDTDPPHTTVFEYSGISSKRQPASRFKLSYYGLPEPKFEDDGVILWRTLFALAACAMILYAASAFYRKRKANKGNAES